MVLLSESPLLNLDTQSVHNIDTTNTDILHALWSVCSRCARTETLPNARRLENLTWRLYSQQSLSQSPERRSKLPSSYPFSRKQFSTDSVPGLSSSPESPISSDDEMGTPPTEDVSAGIHHMGSVESIKSISPNKFGTIVKSVSENNELHPLSLPPTICFPLPQAAQPEAVGQLTHASVSQELDTSHTEPVQQSPPRNGQLELSTSFVDAHAEDSDTFENGRLDTFGSLSTEARSMSVVRGFSKENISQVRRSTTQLAPPQPILRPSPSNQPRQNPLARTGKKKTTTFMVGASSEGDDSSFESPGQHSSLTQGLRDTTINKARARQTLDCYDPENSESAIEDDDEVVDAETDWVDDEDDATTQPEEFFNRIESNPNLRSRPSLLTNMLHETDRAKALEKAASRSTTAIRRSRTSSHNGPLGSSPQRGQSQLSRAQPIPSDRHTSEAIPIAQSPRTNRRNMLGSELTGSLRKHLLWERQQRNPASKALKDRKFRSEIRLTDHNDQPHLQGTSLRRIDTTVYDNGLQEYFEKGW